MQFVIIAKDYKDEKALSRRLAVRDAHIELSNKAIAKGEQLFGVAMLNKNNEMCGSVMILNLPSRTHVNEWLENEPYITGKVWEHVEIIECKVGPSFEKPFASKSAKKLALLGGSEPNLKIPPRRRPSKK
jgi:uncharacterized protein YciI